MTWVRSIRIRAALAAALLLAAGAAWPASAPTDAHNFLNEAVQGSVAEVSLGQMAESKAENDQVRAFGSRMIRDHSQALTQARQLAGQMGVRLVEQLDREHKRLAEELTTVEGAEFDRKYMQAMVDDHRKTVQSFETQANEGSDQIADFAREQLPVLKEHLAEAESLAEQL